MGVEPVLQPLSGEILAGRSANVSLEARLDISARGFWENCFSLTLFDVRVFTPTHLPVSRFSCQANIPGMSG